jgi:hypothetical protein
MVRCSGRKPAQGVGEKALLQDRVEVGAAVIEELAFAEARGEGSGADVAIVIA